MQWLQGEKNKKETLRSGSIIVDLIAGDKSKATVVTFSDIQFILKKTVTATFKAPQHGSYTVNGTQITSDWVNTGSSFDPYTVSATPDSGYIFMGWTLEITDVTGNVTYTAVFDENGKNGLCVDGSDTYWIMNGQNVDLPGLIRINVGTDDKPHYNYYYFAEDGKAVKDGTYKVNKNNGLPLPEFNYDFDADGVAYSSIELENGK